MAAWASKPFMRLFDHFFVGGKKPASISPLFLRVVTPGQPAPTSVDLEVEWHPTGHVERKRVMSAHGLCMLPWRRGNQRIALTIRSGAAVGKLVVSDREVSSGLAHRVTLRPPAF